MSFNNKNKVTTITFFLSVLPTSPRPLPVTIISYCFLIAIHLHDLSLPPLGKMICIRIPIMIVVLLGCYAMLCNIPLERRSHLIQEPCVLYKGRAYRYFPDTPFYIFFQQIQVINILNMLHTLCFSPCKMPFI